MFDNDAFADKVCTEQTKVIRADSKNVKTGIAI